MRAGEDSAATTARRMGACGASPSPAGFNRHVSAAIAYLAHARRLARALALLHASEPAFRRTARRFSLCADDAEDAYQRAVEILLTKSPDRAPGELVAWMQVVIRREALAVRRARERLLGPADDEDDPDRLDRLPCGRPGPAERAESRERVVAAARALAELKPHERLALFLQADGYSYAEIRDMCGWSYTKVNRALSEGRARLRELSSRLST
jgi:RNA polymerase sigma factor (sigma-70 family)